MKKQLALTALASSIAIMGPLSAASAADIKLRLGDAFPAGHYMTDVAKHFIEEVEKRTDTVEIEYYPAQQLGKAKDILSLTQSGVIDIGYVVPAFVSDKLPLSSVGELPGNFDNSCTATKAFMQIGTAGGLLSEKELAPAGVRLVYALVLPPYQVFTKEKPLDSAAALEGLKIRTSGAHKILGLKNLGAVPVNIPTPEIHEAITRGTIDGLQLPMASVPLYDLTDQVKYGTTDQNFGSFVVTYMISNKRYNELPEEVRKAIDEVGSETAEFACNLSQSKEDETAKILVEAGMKKVDFSEEDRGTIQEAMDAANTDWIEGLQNRGLPGKEILDAYNAGMN